MPLRHKLCDVDVDIPLNKAQMSQANLNPYYRTTLCKFLSSKTGCLKGENCNHAHSQEEANYYRNRRGADRSNSGDVMSSTSTTESNVYNIVNSRLDAYGYYTTYNSDKVMVKNGFIHIESPKEVLRKTQSASTLCI